MLAGEKLLIIWMFKDTETMIIKNTNVLHGPKLLF